MTTCVQTFNEVQKLLSKTNGKLVGDLMTTAPVVVRESTNLEDAARFSRYYYDSVIVLSFYIFHCVGTCRRNGKEGKAPPVWNPKNETNTCVQRRIMFLCYFSLIFLFLSSGSNHSVLISFLGVATAAFMSIFKIKPANVNLGTPFKKKKQNKTKTKSDFFIWCLRILLETKYRRLPVVDSEGKLVSEIDVYSPSPLKLIYYYVF